jgi:hypothetical protein
MLADMIKKHRAGKKSESQGGLCRSVCNIQRATVLKQGKDTWAVFGPVAQGPSAVTKFESALGVNNYGKRYRFGIDIRRGDLRGAGIL